MPRSWDFPTAKCRCTWESYRKGCPQGWHNALARQGSNGWPIVATVALPSAPDFTPRQWVRK